MILLPTTRQAAGFTLLELLAALAVAGILAALGWGSYTQHLVKARRAEGRAAVLQVLLQQERQFSYQARYQAFNAGPGESEFKWYSGDAPHSSAYSLSARACEGEELDSCVLVTAVPGGPMVNPAYRDEQCGTLWADSRGRRDASGGSRCW